MTASAQRTCLTTSVTGASLGSTEERAIDVSSRLGDCLRQCGWSCSTAESCTGGLIGSWITALAGSSDYFMGGIIAYSNDAKLKLLGVPQETLDSVGAVSAECAGAMATGTRASFSTDVGVSSTGIAGPGGATARKPVGLIYVAVSTPAGLQVRELRLAGDRRANVHDSALAALELTLHMLQPDHRQ
jgi:nicotinamide-nucleotide amidase